MGWIEKGNDYIRETVFESGITARIEFQHMQSNKGDVAYSVYFHNFHKRKQNTDLKQTGQDGLKPLIWAKNQILEFEDYIANIEEWTSTPRRLLVYIDSDDNQRKRVYERGLLKHGYRPGSFKDRYWEYPEKGLIKVLKKF